MPLPVGMRPSSAQDRQQSCHPWDPEVATHVVAVLLTCALCCLHPSSSRGYFVFVCSYALIPVHVTAKYVSECVPIGG